MIPKNAMKHFDNYLDTRLYTRLLRTQMDTPNTQNTH